MLSVSESGLDFRTLSDIELMINKKQSELESLIRIRNDLEKALSNDFIVIPEKGGKKIGLGMLIGSSQSMGWKVKVLDVIPGSPAESAGVNKGDLIRKIDSKRVDNMSLSKVKDILEKSEKLQIQIRRGSINMNISLNNRLWEKSD